ncbi:hypothetical protein O0235_07680 [Tepidiforma flava]|uniref:SpaA-like prealbumin fold domain-containing protein n=1 Tax=Tepidiforma flava TaxID=3004094 RepID=A0ABY7MA53_9CHLR|nr:hypothetical protein [Tepidiforma flava]WBL37446.1 hypothetical protein O0235_07680 [Tepidiforma flava]
MTLALYGKSRRRQGALITAALLAVIIASIGALSIITGAFAHHNTYSTNATCSGWTATANYVGGSSKVLVVMDNVVIGGQSYQGSWSSGFATGSGTSGGVLQYSGGQIDGRTLPNSGTGAITNLTNVWYWYGVDNERIDPNDSTSPYAVIFNRSGNWPAGSFSGRILLYYQGNNNTWSYSHADSITPDPNDRGTITAPTQPSNCATIIIKKVVAGQGAPSGATFDFTVRDLGLKQDVATVTGITGGGSSSVKVTVDNGGSGGDNDDFRVTETDPGIGWATKHYIKSGSSVDCSKVKDSDWKNGRTADGGDLNNLDSGDSVTVCFLNTYTPRTVKIQVHKYTPSQGQGQDWQNVGKGQGTYEYTLYLDNNGVKGAAISGSFGHLTPSVGFAPQTVWITETNTGGLQFYGWFLPENHSSGNPQCNQLPATWEDGDKFGQGQNEGTAYTSVDLKIPYEYFVDTPGDQTGVYHICAYNKPQSGTLIVGKVKDPTAGVPAADGSQFSGTATNQGNAAVHNWGAITFGAFSTISNIPAGTYTLSETGTQNGWTPYGWAAGSLNQQGQPTCPAEKTSYTAGNPLTNVQVNANETKVVCVMNTKTAQVPTIDKQKATEGYTGGYAYWEIIVNNPENIAQTVKINDVDVTFVSVTGGTCSDSDFSDNEITCSVNANSTLEVKVKKQITTTCREQTIRNTATVYLVPPTGGNPVLIGTAGNSNDTEYTIPADTSQCGLPSIRKEASQSFQDNEVSDPANVAWVVTVTNPNGTNGTTRTVWIKDANVTVTSGPNYTVGASCTIPSGSSFQQELTGTTGVQCTMPAGSSFTFTVKPSPAPQRTCENQVFTNTAYLYMSNGELVGKIGEASSSITLQGNPELCTRKVKVCKVVENNNDGIRKTNQSFTFEVTYGYGSEAQYVTLTVDEGGDGEVCKEVTVPANATVTVIETGAPTGWNHAAGYPKYAINDGSQSSGNSAQLQPPASPGGPNKVTFYNKEKVVKNVTFSKYICDTFGDVPRNEGPGGQDDTGKNVFGGGGLNGLLGPKGPSNDSAPVTPNNDNRGNCALATTPWTFNLWTSNRSNGFGGTLLQTVTVTGSQSVALDDDVIQHMQQQGNTLGVYVEEVYQAGYAFGALKCYTDHLNDDNWEWIDPSALQEQGEIHCIAYNVKITPPKLTVKKVTKAADGTTIQSSDQFSFTVQPNTGVSPASFSLDTDPNTGTVTDTQAVTLPASSASGGVTYTITETAPASWLLQSVVCQDAQGNPVQATVNLQAGTAQVTLQTGGVAAAASDVTCTFTNAQRKGTIIVHKVYPEGFTPDGATFSGSLTSQAEDVTWGPLAVGGQQAIEVPAGGYTVTEESEVGYELVGIGFSAQAACNPDSAVTALSVDDVPGFYVNVGPGETKDVYVCNRPMGTVVIVKYENVPPATAQSWNFTGTVPSLPVSLSTTGTTNSVGTASTTILNVPVGTYSIAETEGRRACTAGTTSSDWETRGLVQVGGSLPGAGAVNAAPIVSNGSLSVPVQAGQTTYVVFGNIGCGSVLSAANLVVNKFSDPFANFSGTTPLSGWTITITGTAGTANGQTFTATTDGAGQAFFLGIPDGTYTVCETLQPGWQNVGSKYNTINQAGLCRTGITVNLNETATVNFYNQPRVTIRVQKTLSVIGFTSPGAGWQFTLTGCGITQQQGTTNQQGVVEFTDLPPAIGCSYTVTETVQSGWTPQFVSQTAQPTQGGQVVTLTFLNIRDFNPPCVDPNDPRCVPPPPTVTPTPPTATPTTPTATPTNTPTPTATPTNTPTPTPTNTPVTQVAGERTPGPGQSPTPLAPATGFGFGQGEGGMSLLLVLAGLVSLSLGLGFLALGRRTNR